MLWIDRGQGVFQPAAREEHIWVVWILSFNCHPLADTPIRTDITSAQIHRTDPGIAQQR